MIETNKAALSNSDRVHNLSTTTNFARKKYRNLGGIGLALIVSSAWPVCGNAATWATLTNAAPAAAGTMLLLSDGTVMVQNNSSNFAGWMRLVPDIHGSYANGTWVSNIASMITPRLYFASNMLPDGRVWVLGGEYSGSSLAQNITALGEIYNPVTNSWSSITSYPTTSACSTTPCFGDDPSMLLSATKILAGDIFLPTPRIYDIPSNTWSTAGTKVYNDRSDEETWAKLPNGNVLTYDLFQSIATGGSYAEVYNPGTNTWSSISPSDGTASGTIPQLSSSALGFELGPILRLQDGRIFAIGATNKTALYDPSANSWSAGPLIPGNNGADDAPAAAMPNGRVLFAADNGFGQGAPFKAPTRIYEFDPVANTISDATPADTVLASTAAYTKRMLVLPTGQVLFSDGSSRLWVYTPDAPFTQSARPVINSVVYNGGGLFTLSGKQINGQSSGSGYGDDVESDENYPIIRLQNLAGNVYYCRTTNWSTVGVDGGGNVIQSVNFTLNSAITPGNYVLYLTGSGIPSFPMFVNITSAEVAGQ
jgi:hypothetical protein